LDDATAIAANACSDFSSVSPAGRCRVDFDAAAGDETYYPILKSSTEFIQKFVSALSYRLVPGLKDQRQQEFVCRTSVQARSELQALENHSNANDSQSQDDPKITNVRVLSCGSIFQTKGMPP
jgi:hypothetical protein